MSERDIPQTGTCVYVVYGSQDRYFDDGTLWTFAAHSTHAGAAAYRDMLERDYNAIADKYATKIEGLDSHLSEDDNDDILEAYAAQILEEHLWLGTLATDDESAIVLVSRAVTFWIEAVPLIGITDDRR